MSNKLWVYYCESFEEQRTSGRDNLLLSYFIEKADILFLISYSVGVEKWIRGKKTFRLYTFKTL